MIKFCYALLSYIRIIDGVEYPQAQVIGEYAAVPTNEILLRRRIIESKCCLYCKIPIIGVAKNISRIYCSKKCALADFELKRIIRNGTPLQIGERSKWAEYQQKRRVALGLSDPDRIQELNDSREIRTRRYMELTAINKTEDTEQLSKIFDIEFTK